MCCRGSSSEPEKKPRDWSGAFPDPVGASDTGGQEAVDTGPTIYTTPNDGPAGATVYNTKGVKNTTNKEMSAKEIKNARQRGVNRAKSKERELVKKGHQGTADDGWSLAERKRIAETGQYPSDTRWHHINDVKRNPTQASNPDNVIPSRGGAAGHVDKYHPKGTQAGSSGKNLNRDQLLKDHMNGNKK